MALALPAGYGKAAPDDWWRGAIVYQIYPRSFQDSNGDGVGDLEGIIGRLDHVASLAVDAIWLSPFYPSPMRDFGYDVADYRNVDPMFGTLADFDRLLVAAHGRGLKVLIDLVLSHSSDRHPWFEASRQDRTNAKADWYVWADAKPDGAPPNNWQAHFGGPAWTWDSRRRQYYLHNFHASQPDLNLHCPAVQEALLAVVRFWLERGVDGFRLDVVNLYAHDPELRDNPRSDWGETPDRPIGMQWPVYSSNRPETLDFVERFRALLDTYGATTSIGEIISPYDRAELLGAYTAAGRLHMAYTFELLTAPLDAQTLGRAVAGFTGGTAWPNWAVSNHDTPRVASRWGGGDGWRAAPLFSALAACLRGSACLYQGEELGLPEAEVPFARIVDPEGLAFWPARKGRDGCRTPMPWTAAADAGFSTAEPWLPIADAHRALAVETQAVDAASPLRRLGRFYAWRRNRTVLRRGDLVRVEVPAPLLAFVRRTATERVVCVFNCSGQTAVLELAPQQPLTIEPVGGFEHHATVDNGGLHLAPWGLAIAAY